MNKEDIKIITLGDIFHNLETKEQAFKFLKYIKNQQQELERYKNIVDELEKWANTQLKVAEENIVESEKWLEVEEEKEHAKGDIHTGKVIKRYMNTILDKLKELKGE